MKKFDSVKFLGILLIVMIAISIIFDLIALFLHIPFVNTRNYILTECITLILAIDNVCLYSKYKKLKNNNYLLR